MLTLSQFQRLRQLTLQWHGPLALADPTTAAFVGVSNTTRKRIISALASYDAIELTPYNSKVAFALLTHQEQGRWRTAQGLSFRFRHDRYNEDLQADPEDARFE